MDSIAARTSTSIRAGRRVRSRSKGNDVIVESVRVEDHRVETRPGVQETKSCLVVRLSHSPGKPILVRPIGLVARARREQRCYTAAAKSTALYWPVTRDEGLDVADRPEPLLAQCVQSPGRTQGIRRRDEGSAAPEAGRRPAARGPDPGGRGLGVADRLSAGQAIDAQFAVWREASRKSDCRRGIRDVRYSAIAGHAALASRPHGGTFHEGAGRPAALVDLRRSASILVLAGAWSACSDGSAPAPHFLFPGLGQQLPVAPVLLHPWADRDFVALSRGGYFSKIINAPFGSQDRRTIHQELDLLRRLLPTESVVVYVNARACARAQPGRVTLFPADADPDDMSTLDSASRGPRSGSGFPGRLETAHPGPDEAARCDAHRRVR